MSDDAYAAFLEKANKPLGGGAAATSKPSSSSAAAKNKAPAVLVSATKDAFYTSDSDEPFEAVALDYSENSLPDEDSFAQLAVGESAPTTILDPVDWDRAGNYKSLIDAVREAGEGNDVRVYRVERSGARVEYWLVTLASDEVVAKGDNKNARLVGVRALAVES